MKLLFIRWAAIIVLILITGEVSYARTYGTTLCQNPEFACYVVKRGDSWNNLFSPREADLVRRVNRMNISLYPGMRIAIPRNMHNLDVMSLSPFPHQINPPGEKL